MDHEYCDHQACNRRNYKQTPTVGLRERTEQCEVRPVNCKSKADDRQPRKNSDEDAEDEEEYFLVEDTLDSGKQTASRLNSHRWRRRRGSKNRGRIVHWLLASRFWEISKRARSMPWGD